MGPTKYQAYPYHSNIGAYGLFRCLAKRAHQSSSSVDMVRQATYAPGRHNSFPKPHAAVLNAPRDCKTVHEQKEGGTLAIEDLDGAIRYTGLWVQRGNNVVWVPGQAGHLG